MRKLNFIDFIAYSIGFGILLFPITFNIINIVDNWVFCHISASVIFGFFAGILNAIRRELKDRQ